MACVYIIYSKEIDWFYIGSCLNLGARLKKHNQGVFSSSFTSKTNDWTIFYHIKDLSEYTARKMERHIKRMRNRAYLLNIKKYPEISQKLIEKYTGSSR